MIIHLSNQCGTIFAPTLLTHCSQNKWEAEAFLPSSRLWFPPWHSWPYRWDNFLLVKFDLEWWLCQIGLSAWRLPHTFHHTLFFFFSIFVTFLMMRLLSGVWGKVGTSLPLAKNQFKEAKCPLSFKMWFNVFGTFMLNIAWVLWRLASTLLISNEA